MFTKHTIGTDRAVGVQLQNLRVFSNMTQQQAANRLNLDLSYLVGIEEGMVRPTSRELIQIVQLYDIAPSRAFAVAGRSPDVDSSL